MQKYSAALLMAMCYILFPIISFANTDKSTCSGKVADEDGVIAYANVIALSKDSTFINGATTNKMGEFTIKQLPYGELILKFSFLGYEEGYLNVSVDTPTTDIGTFSLTKMAIAIKGILVTGSAPQFRLKGDSFITNVSNSILSSIGTASDVLAQIPGIKADDENIVVLDKGAPVIYINNRKIFDTNELSQLQSNDIRTVEVIRNPGAKYDAQAKAVIIIRTKTKESGFHISLLERLRIGKYIGDTEIFNLTYSHAKFDVYLSYYHTYLKNKTKEKSTHTIFSDKVLRQEIDQPYVYSYNEHEFSTGFDYSFIKGHIIGGRFKGTFPRERNRLYGDEEFFEDNILTENLNSRSSMKNSPKTNLVNMFYDGVLSDKVQIHLDVDYVNRTSTSKQLTYEESSIEANDRTVNINSETDFTLWAAKLVGTYTINSKSKLEIGVEYNSIKGDGNYITNLKIDEEDNRYTNDEDKFAGFANYLVDIDKWQLSVGLRYEYSHETSTEGIDKSVRTDKKYNDLYPNVGLSRTFGKINMTLNANRRTRRPSFSELSGNDLYVNRFLTQKGNPYLKKEDYYNINYNLMYDWLSVSLEYTYVSNPINIVFNEEDNSSSSTMLTYKNYDKYQTVQLLTSFSKRFNFWKPQLTLGLSQPFFSTYFKGNKQNHNRTRFSLDFSNDFILPKNFIISLYYTYSNKFNSYLTSWDSYSKFDLRFRKSFFDNTLSLNLYINDIFNQRKEVVITNVDNYSLAIDRKRETRYITFSVQYHFNKPTKSYKGKSAAADDINRL